MTKDDLKREILLHADLIAPGEPMTKAAAAMSVHQTVGYALSSVTTAPDHQRAWLTGQIAYCLARYVEWHT